MPSAHDLRCCELSFGKSSSFGIGKFFSLTSHTLPVALEAPVLLRGNGAGARRTPPPPPNPGVGQEGPLPSEEGGMRLWELLGFAAVFLSVASSVGARGPGVGVAAVSPRGRLRCVSCLPAC